MSCDAAGPEIRKKRLFWENAWTWQTNAASSQMANLCSQFMGTNAESLSSDWLCREGTGRNARNWVPISELLPTVKMQHAQPAKGQQGQRGWFRDTYDAS